MTDRTRRLRAESLAARESISSERAVLLTEFVRDNLGRFSLPVLRARSLEHILERKTIYLGADELIVGERGPRPKAVPTYPEITCHSLEDLRILDSRPKTHYDVDERCLEDYERIVIPFWSGRTMRDRIFAELPNEWMRAYEAGVFTEFMEQRSPGHTVLDDKIYRRGLDAMRDDIARAIGSLDFGRDALALDRRDELQAMEIAARAVNRFAERHSDVAASRAEAEPEGHRRRELERIAEACRRVPREAPRDFHEALQSYWFCHLAVITELNGWDAFSPGHLDQHLWPFYQRGLAEGSLTREMAKELLEAFFIKFNNHPAPPKVGVTAAESGTYTDFANINIGGLLPDGSDGSNELSLLLLEIIDELHLLQPSSNLQLSRKTPDRLLRETLRVVSHGYGFPSIFNADAVVEEQVRQGKSLEDARAGGCSGCVEVGAFGKEAYILTGYFNLMKLLELALHDGVDARSGRQLGPRTGPVEGFETFDGLLDAFVRQLRHFVEIKIAGNQIIERLYARELPAPFLSMLIDDCIETGRDYHAGGARYNNTFIQIVGIGSITDSLAAIKQVVFDEGKADLPALVGALDADFDGEELLRARLLNRTHKYGNDDPYADEIMVRVFEAVFEAIDGRPTARGGRYSIEMLPTTSHVYFGSVVGASADGRRAGRPLSEGISPVQGADRLGPTAVFRSAARMDHIKTGGTLLNMKLTPALLEDDGGLDRLAGLVRGYFRLDGHHVQFNVVRAEDLRRAQENPDEHRELIVRVAGYSDYFCDLSAELQEEIITRTEHDTL